MAQRPSDFGKGAIPLLEDLVLVDEPETTQAVTAPKTSPQRQSEPQSATRSLPRNNPFLPYDHLEQLARERAEFQRQFMQFALNQKSRNTSSPALDTMGAKATDNLSNPQELILENLARQLTQDVIRDLRPQIEQRIRELLAERLGAPVTPEKV